LLVTQQAMKLHKNKHRFGILIFSEKNFDVGFAKFKINHILLKDQPSCLLGETPLLV
jgi:hypothetical protein